MQLWRYLDVLINICMKDCSAAEDCNITGNWRVSVEELSTVCCDVYSKRLWYSQQSRSKCFSGIHLRKEVSFSHLHKGILYGLVITLPYPTEVGDLISGSSAFSKTSFNIWKFTVYVLLKPVLENF